MIALMFFCVSIATAAAVPTDKPHVQVVFVLDTTGSMSGLIQAAKDKIWAIASTIATADPVPEIEIGLVGYRDRGDEYITKVSDVSPDIDAIYSTLLDFAASGGGDGPESVNQALWEAVTKIKWDNDTQTYKTIFLVGDYPPHMDYKDDVRYPQAAEKAKEKGIIINTIQMGDYHETTPIWKQIASATGGDFFQIAQSQIHTHYTTPYDSEIADLSRKYDSTRVFYGTRDDMAKVEKKAENERKIYGASKDAEIAQRSIYNMSDAGKSNFTGENELVDAVASGKVKLDSIPADNLPDSMQKLSNEAKEKFIADKLKERQEYEKQLAALNKKRQEYIQEEIKKNAAKEKDSFDSKVFKSLEAQTADKDMRLGAEVK